jgi:hypothetical protein
MCSESGFNSNSVEVGTGSDRFRLNRHRFGVLNNELKFGFLLKNYGFTPRVAILGTLMCDSAIIYIYRLFIAYIMTLLH